MNTLTQEDCKNIVVLINRSNITGQEALGTAMLLQKLNKIINPPIVKSAPLNKVEEPLEEKNETPSDNSGTDNSA